jgi:putative transposase
MPERPLPQRKTVRLRGYNYAAPNWYFVTICVDGRRSVLGEVLGEEIKLSLAGRVVADTWNRLPDFYPSVSLENFIVMPNHVHGIVVLGEVLPTPEFPQPRKHALSEIIRGFKSMSARKINRNSCHSRALAARLLRARHPRRRRSGSHPRVHRQQPNRVGQRSRES